MPRRLFTELGFSYGAAFHTDWELYRWLRLEDRYGVVLPESLARYRVLPTSLTRSHGADLHDWAWNESRDRNLQRRIMGSTVPPLDGSGVDDDRRRVEELLRVNAQLAAEVRSLARGYTNSPRSGAMTAPRRLAALTEERDALRERLAGAEAELSAGSEHRVALERHRDDLARQVQLLRAGTRGLLRRALARPFRR